MLQVRPGGYERAVYAATAGLALGLAYAENVKVISYNAILAATDLHTCSSAARRPAGLSIVETRLGDWCDQLEIGGDLSAVTHDGKGCDVEGEVTRCCDVDSATKGRWDFCEHTYTAHFLVRFQFTCQPRDLRPFVVNITSHS
jgi:hypothetical protein